MSQAFFNLGERLQEISDFQLQLFLLLVAGNIEEVDVTDFSVLHAALGFWAALDNG